MAYKQPAKAQAPTLTLAPVDRNYKGIQQWRMAIKAAEDIYYPSRKKLYDLYKEIMLDTHLLSVIGKRRAKVTNTRIRFFNQDGSENDIINKLIDTEAGEELIKDIIDCRFYGHSLIWFNGITPDKIDYTLIERAHVKPSTQEVLPRVHDLHGVSYAEKHLANYVMEVGKANDLGLLVTCAPWLIYKKGGVSDFALFAETFGTPFREYIYNDSTAKGALERAAKLTGASQYIVRPHNADFKLHESGQKAGSKDLFVGLGDLCDSQVSKAILHNTMTTDAMGGNYKGEVHEKSEKEVSKADKRFVIRILNEKFRHILVAHGIKANGHFGYEEEDSMPPEKRFEIDMKFAEKFEVEPEYFYEKYKMPIPKSGAAYKAKSKEEKPPVKETEAKPGKGKKKKEKTELSQKGFFNTLFSFLPWVE